MMLVALLSREYCTLFRVQLGNASSNGTDWQWVNGNIILRIVYGWQYQYGWGGCKSWHITKDLVEVINDEPMCALGNASMIVPAEQTRRSTLPAPPASPPHTLAAPTNQPPPCNARAPPPSQTSTLPPTGGTPVPQQRRVCLVASPLGSETTKTTKQHTLAVLRHITQATPRGAAPHSSRSRKCIPSNNARRCNGHHCIGVRAPAAMRGGGVRHTFAGAAGATAPAHARPVHGHGRDY